MPETPLADAASFQRALEPIARRFKAASIAMATLVASVVAAMVLVGLTMTGATTQSARVAAGLGFVAVVVAASIIWMRRWTLTRVAAALEARAGGLDNVVVTAAEQASGNRHLHRVVSAALWQHAAERLATVRPQAVQPLAATRVLAAASVIATALLMARYPGSVPVIGAHPLTLQPAASAPLSPADLRVTVEPPEYAGRSPESFINPTDVAVLEGTRVVLATSGASGTVHVIEPGRAPLAFEQGQNEWRHAFVVRDSRILLVRAENAATGGRLLQIRVDADRRPLVRIAQPGKDLVVPDATGQYSVEIDAEDDVGLGSVILRYTRVAGSGEAFTFEEGDVPVRLQVASGTSWKAHATLALSSLKLEDGDTLVYRAIARDRKPGADPATSETFLIEVGRVGGVASTGFAVPEERDRQGLSQQMLIVKTERLEAARVKLPPAELLEQSRLLAIEQRMVKAEFVFMTGGHVEDEVAEAEAGHELAEGRGENQSQLDLLAAIREMSRAEARLNAGDTRQALVFERGALRALQRAFDRRRDLLRTLPERARIDPGRRLTGDAKDAKASGRDVPGIEPDRVAAAAREVLLALADGIRHDTLDAALAARVLAIDPASAELRRAALTMSTASDRPARVSAARDAQRLLTAAIRVRLTAPPRGAIAGDPLPGLIVVSGKEGRP